MCHNNDTLYYKGKEKQPLLRLLKGGCFGAALILNWMSGFFSISLDLLSRVFKS